MRAAEIHCWFICLGSFGDCTCGNQAQLQGTKRSASSPIKTVALFKICICVALCCQSAPQWIPMRFWLDNYDDCRLVSSEKRSCSEGLRSKPNVNLDAFKILEYFISNLSPLCRYCITDIFMCIFMSCTSTRDHSKDNNCHYKRAGRKDWALQFNARFFSERRTENKETLLGFSFSWFTLKFEDI